MPISNKRVKIYMRYAVMSGTTHGLFLSMYRQLPAWKKPTGSGING